MADRGLGAGDLHLFADPAVDGRRGDGVGHVPGRAFMFLRDRRIEQADARRIAGVALGNRLVDQIGLDQVRLIAVDPLHLAVDHRAQVPAQARTPGQGGVGDGGVAPVPVIVAAETELAKAAIQPRAFTADHGPAKVEQATEGLR